MKTFRPLFDDTNGTHDWSEDERECPVKGNGTKSHKHFYRCKRCGIRRHGAFAEHGNYHYFCYDHPGGIKHELLPPCNGRAGEGALVRGVLICKQCQHIVSDVKIGCDYGHGKGTILLMGCFKSIDE
ncbi:MAG: hypothetical protein ACOYUZ_03900 [Patescibacteria group bacterium]